MIPHEELTTGTKLESTGENGLYSLETYNEHRGYLPPPAEGKSHWKGIYPTDARPSLPALTREASVADGGDKLATLQAGDIMTVERILYHAETAGTEGRAFQCLEVTVDETGQRGFVWTTHGGVDYAKKFVVPPPPSDTPPPADQPAEEPRPSGYMIEWPIEVRAAETVVLDVKVRPASGSADPAGTGSVEIHLMDQAGEAVAVGSVYLIGSNGRAVRVDVDVDGVGVRDGLPIGIYTLSLGAPTC